MRTNPCQRAHNPSRWWMLGLLVLFCAVALRVNAIHTTYMREDEEIAFRTTENHEVGYTIWYQAMQDVHTPTWFVSFWLWQQVFGSGEFMARVYSIFLSALTLAFVYQIGRQWFGGARYGLFALTVLGVNAYAFIYSLEIRPYAMVMLAAALNMWLFRRWLDRQTRRSAILYGASVALLMWIHYFLAFLVMAEVVYLLLVRRPTRRRILQAFGAAAVAFVLWLPYLPVFIGQVQALKRVETSSGDFRGLGIGSTTEVTSPQAILGLANVVTNGLPLLYGAILLIGALFLLRRRNYWLALTWLFVVPALNLLVNLIASVYTQRYLTYISLGLALAVGAVLAALPWRVVRGAALVALAAVSLWTLPSQLPIHTPYRYIFQSILASAQPGDVVLFDLANIRDKLVKWQVDHYLTPYLPATTSDREAAQSARRIWFVTAHWFDDDVRTAFHAVESTHPLQQVIGRCDVEWCYLAQLLEAPPQTTPTLFGERMAFWGADVQHIEPTQIDLRLWWRVEQAPERDYSIGVQVLDADGRLAAQDDGPVHLGNGDLQTSQLAPGQVYIDLRSIRPPAPLPNGTYTLSLVVYQSWDNVRLRLVDGSDSLRVGMIAVP